MVKRIERKVFLRTAYNYDVDEASKEGGIVIADTKQNNRTKQSFKDECDINVIVGRFMKTGVIPQPTRIPQYGDYDSVFSFQEAMQTVVAARENFMTLPAKVRDRFANDPQQFLEFCNDPTNAAEMGKMGLLRDPPLGGVPSSEAPAGSPPGAPPETPASS